MGTFSAVHHHNRILPAHRFHPFRLVVQGPYRQIDVSVTTCFTPPSSSPPRLSLASSVLRARPAPRARLAPRPPAQSTRLVPRPTRLATMEMASTPLSPTAFLWRRVRIGAVPSSTPVSRSAAARPSPTTAMRYVRSFDRCHENSSWIANAADRLH